MLGCTPLGDEEGDSSAILASAYFPRLPSVLPNTLKEYFWWLNGVAMRRNRPCDAIMAPLRRFLRKFLTLCVVRDLFPCYASDGCQIIPF